MSQVLCLSPGKREQTKADNRQAILDAARQVFGELGFETATVRDIIRRTSLSVGAFYNYYRSKEEVFAALADDGARRFKPILRAQSAKATDFESYLRAAVAAYFDFLAGERETWLAGGPGGGTNPEELFAAGYAACFHSAMKLIAGQKKLDVDGTEVSASIGIGPLDTGGFGLTAALVIYAPKLDKATAQSLVEAAHEVCPYSNATRGNIEVTLSVVE